MGTQEGCRDGTVGDAPSGRDTAWGVFSKIDKDLQNIFKVIEKCTEIEMQ